MPLYYHKLSSKNLASTSNFDEFGHSIEYYSASDAKCNIIRMPKDGLVFYAPLKSIEQYAETGQKLITNGTVTPTLYSGINCLYFDSNSNGNIQTEEDCDIYGSQPRAISFWAYPDNEQTFNCAVGFGLSNAYNCGIRKENGRLRAQFTTWGNDNDIDCGPDDNKLHHLVFQSSDNNTLNIYYDSAFIGGQISGMNTGKNVIHIAEPLTGSAWRYKGYICGVRIYNRVLNIEEIIALSKEFKPTV